MLVSFDALAQQFAGYTDVKGKIRREVQSGKLVQVASGLYETDARTDGKYLAGAIFVPSYLSFDYALSVHALIPEAVYDTYTSATFRKGKAKRYENAFGTFLYRDVPAAVYPLGVEIKVEGGYYRRGRLLCFAKGRHLAARAALPRHRSEIARKVHGGKVS